MYTFLVLGIIPGTNLQITLKIWLDSLACMVALTGIMYLVRRHRSSRFMAFVPELERVPLHATRLHLRAQ